MNAQIIKKRVRKILAYVVTGLAFLLLSSFLLLQMPPVQQHFIDRFLGDLTQITGFPSSVKTFRMLWFDRLELENVLIEDEEKNAMIAVERLRINFKLFQMAQGKNISIDGISLRGAEVFLKYIPENDSSEDLNINIFIDRINKRYGGAGGGGASPVINIGEAIVENSTFRYDDGATDTLSGFDYHRFTIDISEGALEKFVIVGDTIQFNIQTLLAKDRKTALETHEFSTFFRISQQAMEFYNLKLQAGQSFLADTIVFRYTSQADLSDFNEKVDIDAHFDNILLHPNDLELFATGGNGLGQPFHLTGDLKGRVNKFRLSNMNFALGQSEMKGMLSMDGLPYLDETFIEARLNNSSLDFKDLSFALNDAVIERLQPLGKTRLSGQFLGYISDFVANGTFETRLGVLKSDINLKINESNAERSTYSGSLSILNFDLGTYLNDTTTFQRLTLSGNIKGSGLTQSTADFLLNSTVQSVGIYDYNYHNISTNARFAKEFFSGKIGIEDPNLKAKFEGSIDLRQGANKIAVAGTLDTANVHLLGFGKEVLALRSEININSSGFVLDSLQGKGTLHDFDITYKDRRLHLADVAVEATREHIHHALTLKSDLADFSATGDFYFSDLFSDIQALVTELQLNIVNDSAKTAQYYSTHTESKSEYGVDLKLLAKDLKPLAELLNLDLSLSPNIKVEGSFTKGLNSMLNVYASIPHLQYNNFIFQQSTIDVNTSKLRDSTAVLAMVFIQSQKQELQNVATENLITEAIWNGNHIDFSVDLDQQKQTNNVRLRGTIDFKDSTYIRLKNSTFSLLDKTWQVNNNTLLSQKGKEWHLQEAGFVENDQRITLHGNVSEDETLPLYVSIRNIDLHLIEPLTTEKFTGLINADLTFRNLYKNTTLENLIDVQALTINNFLVGDITGKNEWNKTEKRFLLDFLVNRQGIEAINLTGYYDPQNETSPLNVTAKLNQASLRLAEPVLRGLFSQIDGTLTGEFAIKGTVNKPQIRGAGQITNGQMMVDYLRTLYKFNGTLGMTPSSIYFENIAITDIYNNKAKLEGFIAHRNFDNMRLNIDGSFTNFMVLNTTLKDNELFYGQGIATGIVNFFGPVSNLKISATAKTERNSKFYIPLTSSGTVEKKEFITFVNFADTARANAAEADNTKRLTGVAIDLNLDITEDAYCEIIFDQKAGDIIRGRGNGDIRLQMDTKGEFTMFGGVTFEQGGYNFTLYNLINKEFDIQQGSRITWSGDPYQGQLNIRAAYNQLASLAPIILDPDSQDDPALRRKYPLQVLLLLEGAMLSPLINFDIVAKDLPKSITLTNGTTKRLDFEFAAFKAKLDEQELKKQVFSLIILRRLSPLNETISTSGSITNSVSELLSNQLSYWMSQVDENLEIDVDLGALDAEAFNTFQLRLSYTFLNGRLRVTRDGTFTNQNAATETGTNSNTAALLGDWTVDYLLTPDGKFKLRMYNRINANNQLNALNNQNTITTGASIQHTQNFNTLDDLWKSAREKREEEEKQKQLEKNTEAVRKEEDSIGDE